MLYALYTLVINFLAFAVLRVVSPTVSETVSVLPDFTINFSVKYIALSSLIALFLSLIVRGILSTEYEVELAKYDRKAKHPRLWYLNVILLIFASLSFCAMWLFDSWSDLTIDQLINNIRQPIAGTSPSILIKAFLMIALPITALLCVFLVLPSLFKKYGYPILRIKLRGISRHFSFTWKGLLCVLLICSAVFNIFALFKLDIKGYYQYTNVDSSFYEEHYVSPDDVEIVFPEKKRNLIYIYLEAMESTLMMPEVESQTGGCIVPNMKAMAEENINFSHNSGIGGFYEAPGCAYTTAGMTAQGMGIQVRTSLRGEMFPKEDAAFLSGAVSIGDILQKQGYNQAVMFGSDASFGSRRSLFEQHGDYEIFDLFTARETGIVPEDYYVWWGFEDKYLYSYAQQEILKMAEEEAPFNFTMLTVDTHMSDGYKCSLCRDEYSYNYSNVYSCADRQLAEFVNWIKAQDFYEDTTIVIVGDHLNKDPEYKPIADISKYVRPIYNAFINSSNVPTREKSRVMYTMDMFPTTLGALGVTIEGNRLGIGTNLFSDTDTLLEELGQNFVFSELNKYSSFYEENLS
jgi:phosphoglycerol transferase